MVNDPLLSEPENCFVKSSLQLIQIWRFIDQVEYPVQIQPRGDPFQSGITVGILQGRYKIIVFDFFIVLLDSR